MHQTALMTSANEEGKKEGGADEQEVEEGEGRGEAEGEVGGRNRQR